jgi:hypothetical protein
MHTIDELFKIEGDPQIFSYKVFNNQLHLWPLIRFQILVAALYESNDILSEPDPLKIKPSKVFSYLFNTFKYRSSKVKKSDILFFGSNISNIKVDGLYFNRLSEYFANEFHSEATIIEESVSFTYRRPRTFEKVYTNDDIVIRMKLSSKFVSLSKTDLNTIGQFIEFLKINFPYSFQDKFKWDKMKALLTRLCKEFSKKYSLYEKLYQKVEPKIIFIEAASYGYGYVPMILAAKKRGIKVVEYQHGLVSLNHPAYNFHPEILDEYKKYMPEFFLTYGQYWKDNCRLPVPVILIGNPFLSQILEKTNQYSKKEQFLYASGAVDPELTVQRVFYLESLIKPLGFTLVFRPHPSELNRLENVYKPIMDSHIKVDRQNLYDTLSESKFVFSDFSTVLLEALAFGCTPIVLKTKGSEAYLNYPDILFINKIEDISDIIVKFENKSYNTENLWEKNWKVNFHTFINSNCKYNTK